MKVVFSYYSGKFILKKVQRTERNDHSIVERRKKLKCVKCQADM